MANAIPIHEPEAAPKVAKVKTTPPPPPPVPAAGERFVRTDN